MSGGGKRQATSDINRDNWDREDEPEERGTFRTATEEELKNRVIKKARRSVTGVAKSEDDGGAKNSIFSGFSGFGKTPASTSSQTAAAASPFSFLSTMSTTAPKTSIFGPPTTSAGTVFPVLSTKELSSPPATTGEEKSKSYYAKLKGLNMAVSEWIKSHVDKTPVCILTPIFDDYAKYLKKIESEEFSSPIIVPTDSVAKAESSVFTAFKFTTNTTTTTTTPTPSATTQTSIFTSSTTSSSANLTAKPAQPSTPLFSFTSGVFGPATTKNGFGSETTAKPTFSFSRACAEMSASNTTKPTPIAAPFSFGNIQPVPKANDGPSTSTGKVDEVENEDEPPKVEFKQVVEDDALYSKKCKLFIKKDAKFSDRGNVTLYLKPIEGCTRAQLLVRVDTNLGNILVNFVLNAAVPVERVGKNNVMLVCLPTADSEKSVTILLRVKTAEEADELFEMIKKHKN